MIIKGLLAILLLCIVISSSAQKVNLYYSDKKPKVIFESTEIMASFNTSFTNFLIRRGHYDKFSEVLESVRRSRTVTINKYGSKQFIYKDTAYVKFILSKDTIMSGLTIKNIKSEVLKQDLMKIIKLSAPFWNVAIQSGRPVNSWVNLVIYYNYEDNYGVGSSARKEKLHIDVLRKGYR